MKRSGIAAGELGRPADRFALGPNSAAGYARSSAWLAALAAAELAVAADASAGPLYSLVSPVVYVNHLAVLPQMWLLPQKGEKR
jgi:hypothetical protein